MARSLEHFPVGSGTPFGDFGSSLGLMLIFVRTGGLIRFIVVGAVA